MIQWQSWETGASLWAAYSRKNVHWQPRQLLCMPGENKHSNIESDRRKPTNYLIQFPTQCRKSSHTMSTENWYQSPLTKYLTQNLPPPWYFCRTQFTYFPSLFGCQMNFCLFALQVISNDSSTSSSPDACISWLFYAPICLCVYKCGNSTCMWIYTRSYTRMQQPNRTED